MTNEERLKDALEETTIWLKAALNCKDWHWDGDQREAAIESLNKAKQILHET